MCHHHILKGQKYKNVSLRYIIHTIHKECLFKYSNVDIIYNNSKVYFFRYCYLGRRQRQTTRRLVLTHITLGSKAPKLYGGGELELKV